MIINVAKSGCGAVGSALDWGSRGREFKSRHSDQKESERNSRPDSFLFSNEDTSVENDSFLLVFSNPKW